MSNKLPNYYLNFQIAIHSNVFFKDVSAFQFRKRMLQNNRQIDFKIKEFFYI